MSTEYNVNTAPTTPPTIIFPNEPHIACVLLLDISGSMSVNNNAPIISLNKAIKAFKEKVCSDEVSQRRVDVAVIVFNSTANVILDFISLAQFEPMEFEANGATAMGEAIILATDILEKRIEFYTENGTPYYKPWIFMITDGMPTDDISNAQKRLQEQNNKLKFWALGVNGYSKETLLSLTDNCAELDTAEFGEIFNWLSDSMITVSKSSVTEEISLPKLPGAAKKLRT